MSRAPVEVSTISVQDGILLIFTLYYNIIIIVATLPIVQCEIK